MTPEELYQRYLLASAMTRNADALADLFAVDGVLESPLISPDHHYPRRLEGREEIRAGMAAFYQRSRPTPARRLIPPGLATSCTPPLIPACSLPR